MSLNAKDKLKKDLKGRIAHAYLFYGPSGSGKIKAAQWFARKVFSKKAPHKDKALKFDVLEIGPDKMGKIGINQVRSVRSFLCLSPGYGARKVVIMAQADRMTKQAANAFLKTLEEPWEERFIILVTQNPRLLPATITSRCVQIRFSTSGDKTGPKEGEVFKKITQGSLNTRFGVAEKLSKKDKAEIEEFLNNLILYVRQTNLFSKVNLIKKANQTRKLLEQTNVKPRLALEHLFLC